MLSSAIIKGTPDVTYLAGVPTQKSFLAVTSMGLFCLIYVHQGGYVLSK